MHLEVGQTYAARYRIARKLGEGAMGEVYEADHLLIHRRVALKVLHAEVAQRHDALRRFEREAQAAGRIGSPHIVEVLDMGELSDGSRFLVMELLEGETLADRLRGMSRMLPEDAAPIACQVLAGLGAAHAADIIHRDLKPANVFLIGRRGDFVKILDFGVSKFSALSDEMNATAPGTAIGTPYYMSPEQAKGALQVDARSDLYSVGVMLYECVSGQVPFDAGTFNELIFRIVLETPPPLESFAPDADPAFVAIVRKAMAREPEARYQSAREMYEALSQWLAQRTGHAMASGALPWADAPFIEPSPRPEGQLVPPITDGHFEHAATLLREPPRRRPLGLIFLVLGVVGLTVGGGILLLAARTDKPVTVALAPSSQPDAGAPGAPPPPQLSASSPTAAPPPPPPASSPTAPPPVTAAAPKTSTPRRPTAPDPVHTPPSNKRTVPSDL